MNRPARILLAAIVASCIPCFAAEPATGLNGATGHIFKVDPANKSFELLKETEYDPKTDLGQSRFTVHWDEDTKITKVSEVTSFVGIGRPVFAVFQGIDAPNEKALAEGKPFEARVVTIHANATTPPAADPKLKQVVGLFTPNAGDDPKRGTLEVDGKPVEVSMRKRFSRIFLRESLAPADLEKGFWQTTIQGSEADGRFVIASMQLAPLADPLATDDPNLPRVLVIGDSISMNYFDVAKEELKGIANFHRNEGNSFSTAQGVRNMGLWLGNYQEKGRHWDVIQFNHGLHDLKQAYDAATDTFGDYAVPLEEYKANLEKEIAIIKKTGAKLIWCATTPVQNTTKGPYARKMGASEVFNKAASEVMANHPEIQINDLHGIISISPVFDAWRKTVDVHFYKGEERQALGKAVAAAVKKALEKPSKKLPLPGETFLLNGRTAFLILPETSTAGKPTPWVWYAPTLPGLPSGAEKWMFAKFLEKGIAIAGIDVGESMGNPAGVAGFSALHKELVTKRSMSAKPCLLARSRGGLMLYNWAVENPDSVSAIAGLYPVSNLASYPGLAKACGAYGLTADELAAQLDKHNPISRLAPLAKAKVPIMHLHGDSDKVVPLELNSGLLKDNYEKLGGEMTLEIIKDGGHDMEKHWFQSQALVDFVIKHTE
jgi:hypothetical protein